MKVKVKFWQGEEDAESGVVVFEVAAKLVTTHGSEGMWTCASRDNDRWLEQVQNQAGAILGVLWRFPCVVIRGD